VCTRNLLVQLSYNSPRKAAALLPDASVGGMRQSSAGLVEIAESSGATTPKSSDLTAMRHFELRG
jgi:hypothetical protein